MRSLFMLLSLAVLVLPACKGCGKGGQDPNANGNMDGRDSLSYELIDNDRQWGECDKDESNCITITTEYPRILDADSLSQGINAFIQEWLLGNMKDSVASIDALTNLYIAEYQRMINSQEGYSTGWQIEKVVTVLTNHHGLFCVRLEEYESTGGAHPNIQTYFANFNLRTKKQLALEDILTKGFEDSLNTLAEFYFRQSRELSFEKNLEEAGFNFKDNKFELNNNFVLDETGLTFVFNRYEVAPYSSGLSEFTIPYAELIKSNLIREDGPLAFLISEKLVVSRQGVIVIS